MSAVPESKRMQVITSEGFQQGHRRLSGLRDGVVQANVLGDSPPTPSEGGDKPGAWREALLTLSPLSCVSRGNLYTSLSLGSTITWRQ